MSLYTAMASVYDVLFPLNRASIAALEQCVAQRGTKNAAKGWQEKPAVLDLGAATGSLVAALRNKGWEAWGIELDPAMVEQSHGYVVKGSMEDAAAIVPRLFTAPLLDGIFCLGNTLPHLDPASRPLFFRGIHNLLKPGAPFVIQTLNYGRSDMGPGFVFPDISAGNVRFSRRYMEGPVSGSLSFQTTLRIECEVYEDATVLYPLAPQNLELLLLESGFSTVEYYAGWDLAPFKPNTDMYCISVARP